MPKVVYMANIQKVLLMNLHRMDSKMVKSSKRFLINQNFITQPQFIIFKIAFIKLFHYYLTHFFAVCDFASNILPFKVNQRQILSKNSVSNNIVTDTRNRCQFIRLQQDQQPDAVVIPDTLPGQHENQPDFSKQQIVILSTNRLHKKTNE